jgi:hypothetical protein
MSLLSGLLLFYLKDAWAYNLLTVMSDSMLYLIYEVI